MSRPLRAASLLALLSLPGACAGRSPISDATAPESVARGYRALFRAEVGGPGGGRRFRMAAALLPPDRLRLEFFGPAGGPRLIVAVDDAQALVLSPADRAYDAAEPTRATLERWVGVPVDARGLIALLTGRPMCGPESAEQQVRTRAAVAFGRDVSWYEVTCPPGDIRYEARCQDRGGVLKGAVIREGISGAIILEVEYHDHEEGLGPRWPRRIEMKITRSRTTVTLTAIEGPASGDLAESIFSPPVPEGFEKRPLAATLLAPGLLGSTADRER
jgi:hypothetical protein